MDELKTSVFQAVEELQHSISNMRTDLVEPVNIDPHTKLVLLSQQVIHEMENRKLLMYSNISDSLHEIIKIIVKDEDGSSQLNGSCFQYFIDSNFMGQLLLLSGTDSPAGYRSMVFEVATILVSVMDSILLLNDEFCKSIQVLLSESIKLEAKVKLEHCLATKIIGYPQLLPRFYRLESHSFPIFDHLYQFSITN